jgi:hypothetical protein
MSIDAIEKKLSEVIYDIQCEKLEIMKLIGRRTMTVIKINHAVPNTPFDLKSLNRHLINKKENVV